MNSILGGVSSWIELAYERGNFNLNIMIFKISIGNFTLYHNLIFHVEHGYKNPIPVP